METIRVARVVEYSQFYPDEDGIDVPSLLKTFDRKKLITTASKLSMHYGNLFFPNEQDILFFEKSRKYKEEISRRLDEYYKSVGLKDGEIVVLSTYRTSLELFRNIFAIKKEEYQPTIADEDKEIALFKIILTLNEKVMRCDKGVNCSPEEQLFTNGYMNNDCNKFDFKSVIATQIHYFNTLVNAIERISALKEASDELLTRYGISSWREYFVTIFCLAETTKQYRYDKASEKPVLNIVGFKSNDGTGGLISTNLIEYLSIGVDDHIPYNEGNRNSLGDNNTDFRRFRSKPLIRLADGKSFLYFNAQLVCERLYTGLAFDLTELLKKSRFNFNKDFVERVLFRNTMFNCLNDGTYSFPSPCDVSNREEDGEPDFYARQGNNLLVMECKTIKVNGNIRDQADIEQLFDDLKQKLACKTRELDYGTESRRPKLKGIGQLAKHIDLINKDKFKWDKDIPNDAVCYPVLVLEDPRILQPGLLRILNRWYDEIIKSNGFVFDKAVSRPVMAVSIHTLFLHDDLIKSKGLPAIIDEFLQEQATKEKDGSYSLLVQADFEGFLSSKHYDKGEYIGEELARWLLDCNT